MKNNIIVLLAILSALLIQNRSSGQKEPFNFYGELMVDNRFRLSKGHEWSWNENRLDLNLEKRFHGKAKVYGDIWLRSFGFPLLTSTDQLFNKDLTSPYNLEIREAYASLYGFIFKNLDVTIGRQRIAWGTADRLNPTDNINAYDLEDIWDFGRHHGSDGIRLDYYVKDFKIEGIYVPFFRPATLPMGDWSEAFVPDIQIIAPVTINYAGDSLIMPENNLRENSSYALKVAGFLGGFDFSFSYLYGREGLPMPQTNIVYPTETPGMLEVKSELYYPRINVFGFDMAGAIGSVGVWGEAAVFLPPEQVIMQTDLSAIGMPPMDSLILDDKPYVKFVAGADYTFRDGSYLNFQYLHGFIHERGAKNLDDYFMVDYEKAFLNDKLKIKPLTGGFVVGDWKNMKDNHVVMYMPSISYLPVSVAEITLGIRWIDGQGDNVFSNVADKDEFFFKVSYKF